METDPSLCTFSSDGELYDAIAFIGQTLGPLYRNDPKLDEDIIEPIVLSLSQSDAEELKESWPFVSKESLENGLAKLIRGAGDFCSEEFVRDYRQLFVGPGPKSAPPWGSVYTDKDQVFYGESTLELRTWLRLNSIEISAGQSEEPEDHIGTMLELMAWLAQNKPELLNEFLSVHFLPWASHVLEIVEHESKHPFYQGLAVVTRLSLTGIQNALDLEVRVPRFYR